MKHLCQNKTWLNLSGLTLLSHKRKQPFIVLYNLGTSADIHCKLIGGQYKGPYKFLGWPGLNHFCGARVSVASKLYRECADYIKNHKGKNEFILTPETPKLQAKRYVQIKYKEKLLKFSLTAGLNGKINSFEISRSTYRRGGGFFNVDVNSEVELSDKSNMSDKNEGVDVTDDVKEQKIMGDNDDDENQDDSDDIQWIIQEDEPRYQSKKTECSKKTGTKKKLKNLLLNSFAFGSISVKK